MSSLYFNLNRSQAGAVDNLNGPLLIVAGAGSGKTRTLTSRLAAILDTGVAPDRVLAITFTNKAAEEMRKRVPFSNSCFIGTFHSLGARILKKEARFARRTPNFSIFDDDDSMRLIKAILKNYNLKENNKISPTYLQKRFSDFKSGNLNNEEISFSETPAAARAWSSVIAERRWPRGEDKARPPLERPKRVEEKEIPSFNKSNDLISHFFQEYESSLQKNNAFDFDDLIEKPVKIFLENQAISEKYQNQYQYILVDEFQDTNIAQYELIKILAGKHKNLSVVGDDQQSIYKFRGSDFRIFLNFERDWPGAKTIFLEQNYRSSANIIQAASALISNNKFQKPKNLWTENESGKPIEIVECRNEDEEAAIVAEKISSSGNTAVLYRTNAQSRAIESALIEAGIAYKIFGGVKFYERKEIKDIVAGLRYANNPSDKVSLDRLKTNFLKKPFEEMKKNLPAFAEKLKPTGIIEYILKISDYFERLKNQYDNFSERLENIRELIYYASEFNNLPDFLERISLYQSTEVKSEKEEVSSFVSLMTIHSSKGLEFDEVFIIGCNEGILPHQMSYSIEEEIEEERRLMYVAMTRAKKKLHISFYNLPSRFLSEIPGNLINFLGIENQKGFDAHNKHNKYETFEDFLDDEERYITYD